MCKITNIKNILIALTVLLFQILFFSIITYAGPAAAPTISVTTPTAGGNYYEGTSISTSGTVTDSNSGNIITVYYRIDGIAGAAGTQVGSTITANTSAQAYSGTIPLGSTTVGAHTLYLWADDGTGRVSAETSQAFTVLANPTLTITASTPDTTTASSVTYTFTFSESVTGFDTTQVTVTNGTKGTFSGSGATYTLVVTNAGSCTQIVTVNAVVNTVAANNANISGSKTVTVDNIGPTPAVTANTADTTNSSSVTYTFTFNETAIGFDSSDVIVTNGTKGTFTAVSGTVYTLVVTNIGNCTQTVAVNAGVCTDAVGNVNTSGSKTITIDITIPPTLIVTASTAGILNATSVKYTFAFSETVTGFDASDITVVNGIKGMFTALNGATYTLIVTNSTSGIQTVTVNAGVCQNLFGINNIGASKQITLGQSNRPILVDGMTPVIFDTNDFRDATTQEIADASWYSYRTDTDQSAADRVANERWANVKLADGSMFVWIPRYTYKITGDSTTSDNTDDKILIKYSNGITDDTTDGYKVHPAFNFGGEQLSGIWVAKFEASNDGSGKVQVKPGITSWRAINIDSIFTVVKAMQAVGNQYGISKNADVVDTHMMKNSEWGAAAYLTEAIRDKDEIAINSDVSNYTGGSSTIATIYGTNKEQSTTGNAYGIYDMSGGAHEYVASYMGGGTLTYGGTLVAANTKYKDVLADAISTDKQTNYLATEGQTDGWALHEVMTSGVGTVVSPFLGYGDAQSFVDTTVPVFVRGGAYDGSTNAGIFNGMSSTSGSNAAISFRPVLLGFDTESFVIEANTPDVTNASSITYTIQFSQAVTGFDINDIIVTNGTKGAFTAVDSDTYTLNVTNSGPCVQVVTVDVGACQYPSGSGNVSVSKTITIIVLNEANDPQLSIGMTPTIFDTSDFRNATAQEITDKTWYNYSLDTDQSVADRVANEKWANVKLVDGSIFVWIPRYTYKITGDSTTADVLDDKIKIKYSKGTIDDTTDGYKVHPAFTFGTEQLQGIWVAKFEASNNGSGKIQVKPALVDWKSITVDAMFTATRAMQAIGNPYGISTDANVIDTHMMKNSEWGAMAYLTESIRDGDEIAVNTDASYYTGGSNTIATVYGTNKEQSTTGNAYGVYDTSGGAYEYIASYTGVGNSTYGASLIAADAKYKDLLPEATSADSQTNYAATEGQTEGWALHEVMIAGTGNSTFLGYSDYQSFPQSASPVFIRGLLNTQGINAGIFSNLCGSGSANTTVSFRPVLIRFNTEFFEIEADTPDTTNASSITYTIQFGEAVTGFDTNDITVTNGTKGTFTAVDSDTYTLNVTNSGPCEQVVTVGAGACQYISGNDNVSVSKIMTVTILNQANAPQLATGMTPIIFDTSDFRNATAQEITDASWYSYRVDLDQNVVDRVGNEKWANVKLADGSMFVWIPRYTYKITGDSTTTDTSDDKILIKYSNGTIDDTTGGYKAHPAFTWDGVTQLSGIWVAKFEASNNGSGKVQVKPGIVSWQSITVDAIFTATRAMQAVANPYGISTDANVVDTHMMKNSEWGAIAYLTESIRDKDEIEVNSNASYYTGGSNIIATVYGTNKEQSTTGNAYGVYDISGGAYEFLASYIGVNDSVYATSLATAAAKYKDVLPAATTTDRQANYLTTEGQTDGWALHEVMTAGTGNSTFLGYSDYQSFPESTTQMFARGILNTGGVSAGIFGTLSANSTATATVSFRPVLLGLESFTIKANTPDTTNASSITYTIQFNQAVTGFDINDITVTNGTKGTFTAVDGDTYTIDVTNSGSCVQVVTVSAGACQYPSGNGNVIGNKTITIAILNEANAPQLATEMIPVIFDTSDFRNATAQEITDKSWYSYRVDLDQNAADRVANEKWANVKLNDGSMFVWVPRYTYKIIGDNTTSNYADDKILIKYSNGTVDDTTDGYKAHPAFNFGGTQLTGMWVAKFEASNNGSGKVQVKPAIVSWSNITVDAIFAATKAMQDVGNLYGINTDTNVVDTHMMKNSEWGAIAYLTEAIRDRDEIEVNLNTSYYTGGSNTVSTIYGTNKEQSTTGNAYGVYDISGGVWESVASYAGGGNPTYEASLIAADAKYKDVLEGAISTNNQVNYLGTEGQTDGWAIHEVNSSGVGNSTFLGYDDCEMFLDSLSPVPLRGGFYNAGTVTGIFSIGAGTGGPVPSVGFRPIYLVLASPVVTPPVAPVTTFSFDGVNANKLIGSDTTMEYSLDGGTVWTNSTDNIDLTPVISNITAINDIKVRVKESVPTPAGEVQTIDILAGPLAPTFSNADSLLDKLIGLPISATNLEGRLNGGLWTLLTVNGTGESTSLGVFNAGDTIDVRVKATGTTLYG
ncbi:MAG TPA: hypothetical protein DEP72_05055, partial [Clostridiales bacterium]|nr:hypothetical protein [Clostridiales bacterium]